MDESVTEITRGCWLDLFESPGHSGKLRRIFGPALYSNLRAGSADHPVRIGSLMVGPRAYVQLFARSRPERSVRWLLPNQQAANLAAARGEEFDSIRMLDRPPFPHDPGYSAFVRLVGRQSEPRRGRQRRRGRRKPA